MSSVCYKCQTADSSQQVQCLLREPERKRGTFETNSTNWCGASLFSFDFVLIFFSLIAFIHIFFSATNPLSIYFNWATTQWMCVRVCNTLKHWTCIVDLWVMLILILPKTASLKILVMKLSLTIRSSYQTWLRQCIWKLHFDFGISKTNTWTFGPLHYSMMDSKQDKQEHKEDLDISSGVKKQPQRKVWWTDWRRLWKSCWEDALREWRQVRKKMKLTDIMSCSHTRWNRVTSLPADRFGRSREKGRARGEGNCLQWGRDGEQLRAWWHES